MPLDPYGKIKSEYINELKKDFRFQLTNQPVSLLTVSNEKVFLVFKAQHRCSCFQSGSCYWCSNGQLRTHKHRYSSKKFFVVNI